MNAKAANRGLTLPACTLHLGGSITHRISMIDRLQVLLVIWRRGAGGIWGTWSSVSERQIHVTRQLFEEMDVFHTIMGCSLKSGVMNSSRGFRTIFFLSLMRVRRLKISWSCFQALRDGEYLRHLGAP